MSEGRIQRLPLEVANQIAAGEVVERPASVVKELVENALDAHAKRIRIEVRDGGRWLEVSDDGEGMAREDATLAFERFATSKLRAEADLWQLASLGFRGEALASIGAISRATLWTRRPQDAAGTEVVVEGGAPPALRSTARAPGTTVRVEELFFNTPARRKFLRAPATELGHIQDAVLALALSRPGVAFELVAHGRVALSSVGAQGDLISVAQALLGPAPWVELDHSAGGMRLRGLVAPPEAWRSDKAWQWWFLNGRWVRHHLLTKGLQEAAGPGWGNKHPALILSLSLPAEAVDVNVHPNKKEVRLHQAQRVAWLVGQGARAAWTVGGHLPEAAPHARPGFESQLPLEQGGGREWPGGTQAPPRASAWKALGQGPGVEQAWKAAYAPLSQPEASTSPTWPGEGPLVRPEGHHHQASLPGMPSLAKASSPGGLRLVGLLQDRWLVAEGPQALWLVDGPQAHAALLLARWGTEGITMAPVTPPLVLEVGPELRQAASGVWPLLAGLGLDLEWMEGHGLWLRAAPPDVPLHRLGAVVGSTLQAAAQGADAKQLRRTLAEAAAVQPGEWEAPWALALLAGLEAMGPPWLGPNGRTCVRQLPLEASPLSTTN